LNNIGDDGVRLTGAAFSLPLAVCT
jgi:hypothetical protein